MGQVTFDPPLPPSLLAKLPLDPKHDPNLSLTADEKQSVVAWYLSGAPTETVWKTLGCSCGWLYDHILPPEVRAERDGITRNHFKPVGRPKRTRNPLTPEQVAEVFACLDHDWTLQEVQAHYHISHKTARAYKKQYGIQRGKRPPAEQPTKPPKPPEPAKDTRTLAQDLARDTLTHMEMLLGVKITALGIARKPGSEDLAITYETPQWTAL